MTDKEHAMTYPFTKGILLSNPGGAIYEKITDEEVKRLPRFLGSVDQLTNLVCVRDRQDRRARLLALYSME